MAAVGAISMLGCSANMYDVVEPLKLPPVECGSKGCKSWNGTDALWRSGNKRPNQEYC